VGRPRIVRSDTTRGDTSPRKKGAGKQVKRDGTGKFQPGTMAGPGRPAGSRDTLARFRRVMSEHLSDGAVRNLLTAIYKRALNGDTESARLLLAHLVGHPRPTPTYLDVPGIGDATNADGVRLAILKAIEERRIDSVGGHSLAALTRALLGVPDMAVLSEGGQELTEADMEWF
jgi:hypothetical protein